MNPDYLRNLPTNRAQSPNNYDELLSLPVVASGRFRFTFDRVSEPMKIDKSFGLIKKDNSVLKFRIVIKLDSAHDHWTNRNEYFKWMYLGEEYIDCRIRIGLTQPFLLKNMSVHQSKIIHDSGLGDYPLMFHLEVTNQNCDPNISS